MKQIARIISTYTADVSGVCSALYELGGMVVMHDPSGCNSTYNTHDEPRWYDMDSLIFISGLAEIDAVMGNDEKLIEDVVTAARQLSPRFIALVRTPIPMLNGTDFEAIAAIITRKTGIPTFYFPTNGTHSYVMGAGLALETILDYALGQSQQEAGDGGGPLPVLTERDGTDRLKVNLLGVTPLDFSVNSTVTSMKAFLEEEGMEVLCCAAMGSSLSDLAAAGQAQVSLVVSSVGLPAARLLEKRCGIPYVVGTPILPFAARLAGDLRQAARTGRSIVSCRQRPDGTKDGEAPLLLVGEAVVSASLAAAIYEKYQKNVRVVCPLETWETDLSVLLPTDSRASEEEDLEALFAEAGGVMADPMYRPICPQTVPFYDLAHEAFSGRIYRKTMPDLVHLLSPLYHTEFSVQKIPTRVQ